MYCRYSRHACQRDCHPGFDFCLKHILEEPKAPFKACAVNVSVPATPTASLHHATAPPTSLPASASSSVSTSAATTSLSGLASSSMTPITTSATTAAASMMMMMSGCSSAALPLAGGLSRPASRKCGKPAAKHDKKDGMCSDHAKKALIIRTRLQSHKRPTDLAQRALEDLQHYKRLRPDEPDTSSSVKSNATSKKDENILPPVSTTTLNGLPSTTVSPVVVKPVKNEEEKPAVPLSDQAKLDLLLDGVPPASQRFLGHGTDVDPDQDIPNVVEDAWPTEGDSDAESVDSDLEDPLKHAGTYSAEEVIRIMRDKLIRLQKLYIDQFQRLQYMLKEERRAYKQSVRKEKEDQLMSIHRQPKDTIEDMLHYDKIKALNHYNRPQGLEAVLQKELMLKRKRHSEKGEYKPPSFPKCSFNLTESTKCGEICIPMSKYCIKHVLQDPAQVLFRECGVTTQADDGPCETPIPHVVESSTCVYHTVLQPSIYEEKEPDKTECVLDEVKIETSQAHEDQLSSSDVSSVPKSMEVGVEADNHVENAREEKVEINSG